MTLIPIIDAVPEQYGILLNIPSTHGLANNKNTPMVAPINFQLILAGGAFF
jgi:hypothetical protein